MEGGVKADGREVCMLNEPHHTFFGREIAGFPKRAGRAEPSKAVVYRCNGFDERQSFAIRLCFLNDQEQDSVW